MVLLTGCSLRHSKAYPPPITQRLIDDVALGDENTANTALLLLSHIALDDEAIKSLNEIYAQEPPLLKKLLLVYTLYNRTQEIKYFNDFIELYPAGEEQSAVWDLRGKTDYVHVTSPLQEQLSYFALLDDSAFKKLLSGYKFADGADAESLVDQITRIYEVKPDLVLDELKRENIEIMGINKK